MLASPCPRVTCAALVALLLALPHPGHGSGGPPTVGIYGVWEGSFTNTGTFANPFDFEQIRLTATFVSPSNRNIVCTGFYDGDGAGGQAGTTWKVRFMGDELGTWRYTTAWSDATPGTHGFFYVLGSNRLSPVRIDPDRPHLFRYKSGGPIFWNGESEWFFLSDDFTQQERFDAIDFLSQYTVNNLLMTLVNDQDHDVFPWQGPRGDLDRSRFNLERLRKWEQVIERLGERGIAADLWFYSDDSTSLIPSAYSFEEDLFFEYLVARFAAYSNVQWNLALEFQEYRDAAWVDSRAQLVRDADPWDHILAVHEIPGTNYSFPGHPNLDRTSLQFWSSPSIMNDKVVFNRMNTEQAGRPIPVVFDEFFIEGDAGANGDLTRFRQGCWAIALGGGFYRAASLGWWIGPPYQQQQHFEIAQHVADLMVQVPFWDLEPANERTSSGFASLDAGDAILVYLPDGGSATVDLNGFSGSLEVVWYNPRTGDRTDGAPVAGGGPVGFSAPDANDWVLYVYDPEEVPPASATDGDAPGDQPILRDPAPNPAAGRARLGLFLPRESMIDAGLYDIAGSAVRSILRGTSFPAGEHTLELEVGDLPAGVYWCRVQTGSGLRSRKLLVLQGR